MRSDNENGFIPSGTNDIVTHYLECAKAACADKDEDMAIHLYLAAFMYARKISLVPNEDAIAGLKEAWTLACNLHERVLAEYIYELLEPYLSADETAHCVGQLQSLALDQLAEFGLSRDAIQSLTNQLANGSGAPEIIHMGTFKAPVKPENENAQVVDFKIPETVDDLISATSETLIRAEKNETGEEATEFANDNLNGGPGTKADALAKKLSKSENQAPPNPLDDIPEDSNAMEGIEADANVALTDSGFVEVDEDLDSPALSLGEGFGLRTTPKNARAGESSDFEEMMRSFGDMLQGLKDRAIEESKQQEQQTPLAPPAPDDAKSEHDETFADLIGYKNAIQIMESYGIGLREDPEFEKLVDTLNEMHGIDSMPATDSLLFSSIAREDANQFMLAAANETGLPVLRMSIDQNIQGSMMLCLAVRADNQPKMKKGHVGFDGPAVLCLEDIDLWMMPPEDFDDSLGSWHEHLARGAQEAVNLISSAALDPNVYLFATISQFGEIDEFFSDIISPFSVIDINSPDEEERLEIWEYLRREHPSLRDISLTKLIELSANMPRFDIYSAVREAVEEAYKQSLALREYVPVTGDNLFEKLSAYQPVDSEEYRKLEDMIASNLRDELDSFETVDSLLGFDTESAPGSSEEIETTDDKDQPPAPAPPKAPDFSL